MSPQLRNRIVGELTIVVGALLIAMVVCSLLILAYGQSPLQVYSVMAVRSFGDAYGFGQVLFKATPLLFTGLAVVVAFRAGLFNIGAEGQMVGGAFATALVGAALPAGTPAVIALPVALGAGLLVGGLLGAIPGVLKARFGAHEVLNTIMLNFIVQPVVMYYGRRSAFVEQTVHTEPVVPGAVMPSLGLSESASSWAFPLGVVVAVACAVAVFRTPWGYRLRAVGCGPDAARTAGLSVPAMWIQAMAVSGALAGLVGSGTVLGYKGYFEEGVGSGAGFMGIAVALLARNHPIMVVPAALLFGALSHGGLAANAFVPRDVIDVLQAMIILSVTLLAGGMAKHLKESAWKR